MATAFARPSRISGVKLAELRVREIGASPAVMAKLALVTTDLSTAGQFVQHTFSERTHRLLQELYRSIEADAADLLSEPETLPGTEYQGDPEDADEGLTF
jgi:hypothetical protein